MLARTGLIKGRRDAGIAASGRRQASTKPPADNDGEMETDDAGSLPALPPHSAEARRLRAIERFRQMQAEAMAADPSPATNFLPEVYRLPSKPTFGATNSLTLTSLLAANLHLGHKPRHLSHYMLPYIYGERSGIHIINLEHTLVAMRRAMNVVREISTRGGAILFVGTRLGIHKVAVDAARKSGAYFCIDWKEGLITNKERLLKRSTGYDPSKSIQADPEQPGKKPLTRQPKVRLS
jgi:hypothetical protein